MIKDKFIKAALSEAKKSEYMHRVGCVIYNKNRIISLGHNYAMKNRKKLNPIYQKWKGSVHAEVDAILNARRDLKNCHLLVIRINRRDEFRLSLPCLECQRYINHVGISKVFYSINIYPHIELMEQF